MKQHDARGRGTRHLTPLRGATGCRLNGAASTRRTGDELMVRASAIVGMVASPVWIVALVVEYQFGLRPPGDGSALYQADQAAFTLAELGYLLMLIGLFRSHAGGDGTLGRTGIVIWAIAIGALALGQLLQFVGVEVIPLLPIGGLGQLIGSLLAAIAVWRAGRWTGWRRLAPAIWAFYTFILFGAIGYRHARSDNASPRSLPSVSERACPRRSGRWPGSWWALPSTSSQADTLHHARRRRAPVLIYPVRRNERWRSSRRVRSGWSDTSRGTMIARSCISLRPWSSVGPSSSSRIDRRTSIT
jgi:hypothetical protein